MFAYICLGTSNLERAVKFYDLALAPLAFTGATHLMSQTGKGGQVGESMSLAEHTSWHSGCVHPLMALLPLLVTAQWLPFERILGPRFKIFMPLHLSMEGCPKGLQPYVSSMQKTFMRPMCATLTVTKLLLFAGVSRTHNRLT